MNLDRKTLCVWLITVIAGTIISSVFMSKDSHWDSFLLVLFGILSGILSIPGMLIFHATALQLHKKGYFTKMKTRLVLALVALALTFISSGIFFPLFSTGIGLFSEFITLFILPYAIPFALCALFFDYSTTTTPENTIETEDLHEPEAASKPRNILVILTALTLVPYTISLAQLVRYLTISGISSVLFHYALIPLSLSMLWKKKKAGWVLLVLYNAWALGNIVHLFFIINLQQRIPLTAYTMNVLDIIIEVASLILLYQKSVLGYYSIRKNLQWGLPVAGFLAALIKNTMYYYVFMLPIY